MDASPASTFNSMSPGGVAGFPAGNEGREVEVAVEFPGEAGFDAARFVCDEMFGCACVIGGGPAAGSGAPGATACVESVDEPLDDDALE